MNLTLQIAERELFARYFSTYYTNIWFRTLKQLRNLASEDNEVGYWILNGETKVAGVIIDDDSLSYLFAIPPYNLEIVDLLKPILKTFTSGKQIDAYCVLDDHLEAFQNVGFKLTKTRSCMIRPTEKKDIIMSNGYTILHPKQEDASAIIRFLYESNLNGVDEESFEETSDYVNDYFMDNNHEHLQKASSIIYDHNKTVVGLCLVSLWEGLPLIYDVAVKPDNRGTGLGTIMLNRAINEMYDKYPAIRLFVSSENDAKGLYTKIGFLSGGNYSTLRLE